MTATELGRALRRWRDRVPPQAAGLPTGGHRRAAGLRREELALLAGISADYVTRLEQGRASNPSAQIVEALARALRLSADERAHLFRLADLVPPGPETVPGHLTPSVRRLLDRLSGTPVGVHDAAWTLLEANPPYAALMGDPGALRGFERNGVWRAFLGPRGRVRHTERERRDFEAGIVADLRATVSRYPATPGCGNWWRGCGSAVPASPSCGSRARSAGTRRAARSSTTPRPARSPWTATSSPCAAAICG